MNVSAVSSLLLDLSEEPCVYWLLYIPFYTFLGWAMFAPYVMGVGMPSMCAIVTNVYMLYAKWRGRDDQETQHWVARCLARYWRFHGRILHGFEVEGLENIPDNGPALLVYYHGVFPFDCYYLNAEILLEKKRHFVTIVDRFMFRLPGFPTMLTALKCETSTVPRCIDHVHEGEGILLSPGGVREAVLSENYELMWNKRKGFAKIAKETGVPVIPYFTRNIREGYRFVTSAKSVWKLVYDWTRLPVVPLYGAFPVKFKTYVGKPIKLDYAASVDEIAEEIHRSYHKMLQKHQPLPGSILRALWERLWVPKTK